MVVDSIKTVNESTWIVDCGADLEEVFQFFQLELPSGEEYEPLTVNGWLMDELDKIRPLAMRWIMAAIIWRFQRQPPSTRLN